MKIITKKQENEYNEKYNNLYRLYEDLKEENRKNKNEIREYKSEIETLNHDIEEFKKIVTKKNKEIADLEDMNKQLEDVNIQSRREIEGLKKNVREAYDLINNGKIKTDAIEIEIEKPKKKLIKKEENVIRTMPLKLETPKKRGRKSKNAK